MTYPLHYQSTVVKLEHIVDVDLEAARSGVNWKIPHNAHGVPGVFQNGNPDDVLPEQRVALRARKREIIIGTDSGN